MKEHSYKEKSALLHHVAKDIREMFRVNGLDPARRKGLQSTLRDYVIKKMTEGAK